MGSRQGDAGDGRLAAVVVVSGGLVVQLRSEAGAAAGRAAGVPAR